MNEQERIAIREARREFLKHIHQSRIRLAELVRTVGLNRNIESLESARLTTIAAMLDEIVSKMDNVALD